MLKQPLSQTAKVIQSAKADIVGIQETRSPRGDTLEDLAKLLGWNHDMESCIVTRYEIVEHFKGGKDYKGGIKTRSLQISMPTSLTCTSHLTPTNPISFWASAPSGKHTNNITFIKTEAETIDWAQKARGKDVAKLLKQIKGLPYKDAPVL